MLRLEQEKKNNRNENTIEDFWTKNNLRQAANRVRPPPPIRGCKLALKSGLKSSSVRPALGFQ